MKKAKRRNLPAGAPAQPEPRALRAAVGGDPRGGAGQAHEFGPAQGAAAAGRQAAAAACARHGRAARARGTACGLRPWRRRGARCLQRDPCHPVGAAGRAAGTGHAVQQAMPGIPDDHQVLVLYGDVPLLRAETLRELVALASDGQLALLTVKLADPTGYGRVVRDARGRVRSHRRTEGCHAPRSGASARATPACWCCPRRRCTKWLAALRSDNAQGEYYLTDVIAMAVKDRRAWSPLVAAQRVRSAGRERQAAAGAARGRVARAARRRGAARRRDAGRSRALRPARHADSWVATCSSTRMCVFEGKVELGDRVRVGPNCVLRDVTRRRRHRGASQQRAGAVPPSGADCSIGPFARLRPGAQLRGRRAHRQFRRGEEQQRSGRARRPTT